MVPRLAVVAVIIGYLRACTKRSRQRVGEPDIMRWLLSYPSPLQAHPLPTGFATPFWPCYNARQVMMARVRHSINQLRGVANDGLQTQIAAAEQSLQQAKQELAAMNAVAATVSGSLEPDALLAHTMASPRGDAAVGRVDLLAGW